MVTSSGPLSAEVATHRLNLPWMDGAAGPPPDSGWGLSPRNSSVVRSRENVLGDPMESVPFRGAIIVAVAPSDYIWDLAWQQERARLDALAAHLDRATFRHSSEAGVSAGWKCLEIGGGSGATARWQGALPWARQDTYW
jgi:hypothetical protein